MFNIEDYALNFNVDDKRFRESLLRKRIEMAEIAIKWDGDTREGNFIFHNIWTYKQNPKYVVSLGKYGKEFYEKARNGEGIKNCNDMRPSIIHDREVLQTVRGKFEDIFKIMESLKKGDKEDALKAFAILFFRNALLLDHTIYDGKYLYQPNGKLVHVITDACSECEGVPTEVYIHFLDAIGFNEDVKYYTQGKLNRTNGVGRENNMRTYIYNICCILGQEYWSDFVYKLMKQTGVAPINNKKMAMNFPELELQYREPRHAGGQRNRPTINITDIINQEPITEIIEQEPPLV